MKISSAFPSEYLKASDLQGHAVPVKMSHVTMVDLNGEPKPVLHFQGKERGMILNKTNANKITEMFGDDTDDWEGGEVILYEAMVDFQGKTVPAIRIRMAPRKVNNSRQNNDSDGDRLERASRPDPISPNAKSRAAEIIDDEIPFVWITVALLAPFAMMVAPHVA